MSVARRTCAMTGAENAPHFRWIAAQVFVSLLRRVERRMEAVEQRFLVVEEVHTQRQSRT